MKIFNFQHVRYLIAPWMFGSRINTYLLRLLWMDIYVIICVSFCWITTSLRADEPANIENINNHILTDKKMFDAKHIVDSLVSHNNPPKFVAIYDNDELADAVQAGDVELFFEKQYDWNEQDRIPKVINSLMDHAEEAWPELVNALGDERYSATYRIGEHIYNLTVDRVCSEIIIDNLILGFYFHSVYDPVSDGRQWQVIMKRAPVEYHDPKHKELKDWCQARKDKKLYELQIEACEWAIKIISEDFPKATEESKLKAREAIKAEIKTLKETKKPLHPECFYMRKGAMEEGGGPIHKGDYIIKK
jgi:hypothetical protein